MNSPMLELMMQNEKDDKLLNNPVFIEYTIKQEITENISNMLISDMEDLSVHMMNSIIEDIFLQKEGAFIGNGRKQRKSGNERKKQYCFK